MSRTLLVVLLNGRVQLIISYQYINLSFRNGLQRVLLLTFERHWQQSFCDYIQMVFTFGKLLENMINIILCNLLLNDKIALKTFSKNIFVGG